MVIQYSGAEFFRQRLILSTISRTEIYVKNIRANGSKGKPGLTPAETALLQLLDLICEDSHVIIGKNGKSVRYIPGTIINGEGLSFDCGTDRGVSYFLEPLILLAPFGKKPLKIKLYGLTNTEEDGSVEKFRLVTLPLLKSIGIHDLIVEISKRGCWPNGGGEVSFQCPIIRSVDPFQNLEAGRVKRIRGVAFHCHTSPQFVTRMTDHIRAAFNSLIPDVWVYTDSAKGDKAGKSEGYGVSLVAETLKGCYYGADFTFDKSSMSEIVNVASQLNSNLDCERVSENGSSRITPLKSRAISNVKIENLLASKNQLSAENKRRKVDESTVDLRDDSVDVQNEYLSDCEVVGQLVARKLMVEIAGGGICDSEHQHIFIYFMALADEIAACKITLNSLSPYSIHYLRHIKDFLGVEFEFQEYNRNESEMDTKPHQMVLKCVGVGYKNLSRKSF